MRRELLDESFSFTRNRARKAESACAEASRRWDALRTVLLNRLIAQERGWQAHLDRTVSVPLQFMQLIHSLLGFRIPASNPGQFELWGEEEVQEEIGGDRDDKAKEATNRMRVTGSGRVLATPRGSVATVRGLFDAFFACADAPLVPATFKRPRRQVTPMGAQAAEDEERAAAADRWGHLI